MNRWSDFVRTALGGPPDDPFVRLLRDQLATGSHVMRVNFPPPADGRSPEYLVVLLRDRQLSDLRIPHSPAFHRWSLEAGAKLETPDEEARRFGVVLAERLGEIEKLMLRDQFEALLVQRVGALAMPSTAALLAGFRNADFLSRAQVPAWAEVVFDQQIATTARDLGRALDYSEAETSDILDHAVKEYVDRRLGISESEAFRLSLGGMGPGRQR